MSYTGAKTNVFIGNLKSRLSVRYLRDLFLKFGDILDINPGKHHAIISFSTEKAAATAIEIMNGSPKGCHDSAGINVRLSNKTDTSNENFRLSLANIPDYYDWQRLKHHFRDENIGDITYADVYKRPNVRGERCGCLEFKWKYNALLFLKFYHDRNFDGQKLYISPLFKIDEAEIERDTELKKVLRTTDYWKHNSLSGDKSRSVTPKREKSQDRSRSRERTKSPKRARSQERQIPERRYTRSRSRERRYTRSRSPISDKRDRRSKTRSPSARQSRNRRERSITRSVSPDRRRRRDKTPSRDSNRSLSPRHFRKKRSPSYEEPRPRIETPDHSGMRDRRHSESVSPSPPPIPKDIKPKIAPIEPRKSSVVAEAGVTRIIGDNELNSMIAGRMLDRKNSKWEVTELITETLPDGRKVKRVVFTECIG